LDYFRPRWKQMMHSIILAHTVLVITAAVLFYMAWTDMWQNKIRNELVLVLVGLFVIHAILSGRWIEMYGNFAVAILIFLILLIFYSRKALGGGDVKLLTVAFLWVGYSCMLPFAIFLLLFTLIHAILANSGLVKSVGIDRKRIPFAPTVAAALIGTFMVGCLNAKPSGYGPNNVPAWQFKNLEKGKPVFPPLSR
jgi:prepilin peptidase CpaA